MRTSKFTVEQISSTLRRAESGVAVPELFRELGITETADSRAPWMSDAPRCGLLARLHPPQRGRE